MAPRGLICVSVLAEDAASIPVTVAPVLALVDVVEVRIDGLRDPLISECIAAIAKPVLATNRPIWEGGRFAGSEAERVDSLIQAVRDGARWVDIELRTAPEHRTRLFAAARAHGAQVVISCHDFSQTPATDELRATLAAMIASSADSGKIVTTATSPNDALRILALQQDAWAANFPLSAFAMGAAGTISRLATLFLGGHMTYAALSREQATAPGQLTVQDLHALIGLLERNHG